MCSIPGRLKPDYEIGMCCFSAKHAALGKMSKDVSARNQNNVPERSDMFQGRIQDFKLGGVHLKKMRRAEGDAKIVGVFRVKNHDFTPKKSYFFKFSAFGLWQRFVV